MMKNLCKYMGGGLTVVLSLLVNVNLVNAECGSPNYIVFYVPLAAEFVKPPTRETIKSGLKIEVSDCSIKQIFELLETHTAPKASESDYAMIRILVMRESDGQEFLITRHKWIVHDDMAYKVDEKIVNEALVAIVRVAKDFEEPLLRPAGVPNTVLWAKNMKDMRGGYWIYCSRKNEGVFICDVFEGKSGEQIKKQALFRLVNGNRSDELFYDWYDGNIIGLREGKLEPIR